MTQLTIQLPDDLARTWEGIAAAANKSVADLAVERLRSLISAHGSPAALLQALSAPPHLTAADVDELEAAIAGGRLPVRDRGAFED